MMNGKHLTSEQMDRLLASPEERAECMHLQMCGQCYEELRGLEAMFGALRVESADAALLERGRAVLPRRGVVRGWAFGAVAAALIAVVAVPVAMRHERATNAPVAVAAPADAAKKPAADAMSDEALLNSIQDDLSASEPAALSPLAVRTQENTQSQRKN